MLERHTVEYHYQTSPGKGANPSGPQTSTNSSPLTHISHRPTHGRALTFPSIFCRSYFDVPGPPRACDGEAHSQDSVPLQASSHIGVPLTHAYNTLYRPHQQLTSFHVFVNSDSSVMSVLDQSRRTWQQAL